MDQQKKYFTDIHYDTDRERVGINVLSSGDYHISLHDAIELRDELNIAIQEGFQNQGYMLGIRLQKEVGKYLK